MAVFFPESGRLFKILMFDIEAYQGIRPVQQVRHDNSDTLAAAGRGNDDAMRWRVADKVFAFVFTKDQTFACEQAGIVYILPGRPECITKFRLLLNKEADNHAGHHDVRDCQRNQETGFYAGIIKVRNV